MNRMLTAFVLLLLPYGSSYAQTEPGKTGTVATATGSALSETHRFLAAFEGTWTEEVTIWTATDEDPKQFTLTTVISTILGGRFVQFTQTGELYDQSFEGLATLGYDKDGSNFTLCWITTESANTLVLEGRWKEPGKSIVLNGTQRVADQYSAQVQQIVTFEDKDSILVQQYTPDDRGALFKSREYRFSRQ